MKVDNSTSCIRCGYLNQLVVYAVFLICVLCHGVLASVMSKIMVSQSLKYSLRSSLSNSNLEA